MFSSSLFGTMNPSIVLIVLSLVSISTGIAYAISAAKKTRTPRTIAMAVVFLVVGVGLGFASSRFGGHESSVDVDGAYWETPSPSPSPSVLGSVNDATMDGDVQAYVGSLGIGSSASTTT